MFRSLKGSVRYVQACSALGSGDVTLALSKIEEAKRFLGKAMSKPSVYYVNLKAAEIYFRTGDQDTAKYHLDAAVQQILSNGRLGRNDKDYLLDYCDLFRIDITGNGEISHRLSNANYNMVTERVRKEFPIFWPKSSAPEFPNNEAGE